MGITVGIDLGTTNSAVSVQTTITEVLRNDAGHQFTPSIVARVPAEDGTFTTIVGEQAKQKRKQYPESTIVSIKRLMGRQQSHPEIQKILQSNHSVHLIEDDEDQIILKIADLQLAPEAVSAEIIKKVIADAEAAAGDTVDAAVVTVPAYFTDAQKHATMNAVELAGIKLLRLVPEPTAAAISSDLLTDSEDAKTFLVFDLGGGTFDLSLITAVNNQFLEVTKGGDMWLGGDDIDQDIVNYVLDEMVASLDLDNQLELLAPLSDTEKLRFMTEISELAEQAKVDLSRKESVNIDHFGILKDAEGSLVDIDIDLTREKFETLIEPRLERLRRLTARLLAEVSFETSMIDTVLLVGGTSQIPAIKNTLSQLFDPEKIQLHRSPMTAVAEGAARLAKTLINEASEPQDNLLDVHHSAAHDYYIKLAEGKKLLLVEKNTPLPFDVEKDLTFVSEDQLVACLKIYNDVDGLMELAGQAWFDVQQDEDIFNGKIRNSEEKPKIKLRFHIDQDNIITLEAYDLKRPEHVWQEKLARSELQQSLYQELENTLSRSIHRGGGYYMIALSSVIRKTIDTIDQQAPNERKRIAQKARIQMSTFYQLAAEDSNLSTYLFFAPVQAYADLIFEEEERQEFIETLANFKKCLSELEDAMTIDNISDNLADQYGGDHIVCLIARCENQIEIYNSNDQHSKARAFKEQVTQLAKDYSQDKSLSHHNSPLWQELQQEVAYLNGSDGRQYFDRDVELA